MDFRPSDEQRGLIERARDFAAGLEADRGGGGEMSRAAWRNWGAGGWLGLCLPTGLCGSGQGALAAVLAFEEMGRRGVSRGALFSVGAHLFGAAMAIANHAGEEMRALWCPRLASGKAVGALAFSEDGGGSELRACDTALSPCDGGYRVTGSKTLVTNGALADLFIVLATAPGAPPPFNATIVAIPRDTDGLSVEPIEHCTGLAETGPARIALADCFVPDSFVLGRPGGGLGVLLDIMRWERSCILAGFLGAAERDLGTIAGFLSDRGGNLLGHQAVSHQLARIRTTIESARWLLYRSAWEVDHGDDAVLRPALAKFVVSNAIVECALATAELSAGKGWSGELDTSRAVADTLGTLSASGTSNVQLNTIASQLGRAG